MANAATFTFVTTHDALEAEEALLACDIEVEPVPTPPQSGTRCGIAMRVALADREAAAACIGAAGVVPAGVLVLDSA